MKIEILKFLKGERMYQPGEILVGPLPREILDEIGLDEIGANRGTVRVIKEMILPPVAERIEGPFPEVTVTVDGKKIEGVFESFNEDPETGLFGTVESGAGESEKVEVTEPEDSDLDQSLGQLFEGGLPDELMDDNLRTAFNIIAPVAHLADVSPQETTALLKVLEGEILDEIRPPKEALLPPIDGGGDQEPGLILADANTIFKAAFKSRREIRTAKKETLIAYLTEKNVPIAPGVSRPELIEKALEVYGTHDPR